MAYFILQPITLGGLEHIVEIDECYLVKIKFNIGRIVRECWILVIHDLTDGLSCFIHVPDRKQVNLERIIAESVRAGSIIITDYHAGYNNLILYGYEH